MLFEAKSTKTLLEDTVRGNRIGCLLKISKGTEGGRISDRCDSERDKFESSTVRASIHGTTKRWMPKVNHFIDIFHLNSSGMKSELFLRNSLKKILQDTHNPTMQLQEGWNARFLWILYRKNIRCL